MTLFLDGTSVGSAMDTSNFAHVIFQNVGKSYLPHAALECHYTLTQFIKPHQKDWVGIFKVGWSTARDYYTFLWCPVPEDHTEGTAIHRAVVFQGYYVPNDDGEFYQFCYVTHKGEIRGASTPFLFRAQSPSEDELLTVEDECNSDILVVTTRTGYLEQKMEEAHREKEELVQTMSLLQNEKVQLEEEKGRLHKECEQEKEKFAQLSRETQEVQVSCQALQEEREEVKRRLEEATARVLQLEDDLIRVTQKGLQKETELDSLKDRVKKLTLEKDGLESHQKDEKDEKELYKIHLKKRELENTKLSAELQMLKAVDVNKENTIAQFKEEVGRLRSFLTEKEKQHQEVLAQASPLSELKAMKEQLRQKEEQLQAKQQQASMLSAELRDASSARDRTMADLYRMRLETDALQQGKQEALAQCSRLEGLVKQLKDDAQQEAQAKSEVCRVEDEAGADPATMAELQREVEDEADPATVAELQREVEDLKLRLHMAAEHYKEKYKECQRLQRQVVKLSEQPGELRKNPAAETMAVPLSVSPDISVPGSPGSADPMLEAIIQEKLKGFSREASDRSDKYRKCKQMLSSQVAEKGRALKELKDTLSALMKDKERLEEDLQTSAGAGRKTEAVVSEEMRIQSVFLQYPLPYPQDAPTPLLVPQSPTQLHFGNPYSTSDARDGADGEFSDDLLPRLPPVGPPSWDSNVVCIQPARNLSRPDGLEDPEEQQNNNNNGNANEQPAATTEPHSPFLNDGQTPLGFKPSVNVHMRCPLCELIFPPNYDQSKFAEHVESHWKVCPMCSEQFPLDCDQKVFENHVLTHFDSANVLNFD
ncbi:tax1-binding protein 1 homolog B isoform X5 [Oncorhynchus kisutch]|uniref:Tax1 (human T-cell leukemia virus type I) binding protein 1b n=1 Tax=Oncorhynchus kisutch TaxID=8019 RepID=A0A8C7HDH2_ONCKI|nr:tax1-binding protein 1 homolog B-like isoform X5 [Oncorhynchus kisutch]XP_031673452.1 tax1-binding protein 1 homolog B isoform X5 [Oncorhynchus kisutch]